MKNPIFYLFFLISFYNAYAQSFPIYDLYNSYENFKENRIKVKRFTHADLLQIIKEKENKQIFNVKEIGKSLEGRSINILSIGSGKTTVLLWSQMHGDEPTATMALLDLFNFFEDTNSFKELKSILLNNLNILFVPMLNPDGAERFTRRNRAKIDLNRDALRLTNPESKILFNLQETLKPTFGFNLHDQGSLYTAGNTYRTATLSFLLPAFNYKKDIDDVRNNGIKVIVDIYKNMSVIIPGHIGRYDDEFEPRAFGDNFVKWRISSILIESGGWKDDYEKQFVRKLNFLAILSGLYSIATNNYTNNDSNAYFSIPENNNKLFDLIIRNAKIIIEGTEILADIAINRNEITNNTKTTFFKGTIAEFGDLSTFYGSEEILADNMFVKPGKVFEKIFNNINELENIDFDELISKGYCYVKVKNLPSDFINTKYPINIVSKDFIAPNEILLGTNANFVIYDNNKIRYAIINGFLYDNLIKKSYIYNSIILK